MYAVEIENLSKFYGKERFQALKSINLKILPNQIFGILGSNGAGKTTLLSIIATTLSPDEGTVKVFGLDVKKDKKVVRELINLCSGYGGLWSELSVWENVIYYGKMHQIPNYKEEGERLLEMVGLLNKKKEIAGDLSTGMKQRLSLVLALLSKPKLLLLDEPTTGLDPKIAQKVRRKIRALQRREKITILLTTHNMYEAEYMCDNIALIKDGEILAVKPVEELKEFLGNRQILEVKTKLPLPALSIKGVTGVERKRTKTVIHVNEVEKNLPRILRELMKYGIKKIAVRDLSLEELYVENM